MQPLRNRRVSSEEALHLPPLLRDPSARHIGGEQSARLSGTAVPSDQYHCLFSGVIQYNQFHKKS
jgi:hypothetical protein